MRFDLDKEIEGAKRRLYASIYGRERVPIELYGTKIGTGSKIIIGEYELIGVRSAVISIHPQEITTLDLSIYVESVVVNGMK